MPLGRLAGWAERREAQHAMTARRWDSGPCARLRAYRYSAPFLIARKTGAAILRMANQDAHGDGREVAIASLIVIVLLTFVSFLAATKIPRLVSVIVMHVRGVLLSARPARSLHTQWELAG